MTAERCEDPQMWPRPEDRRRVHWEIERGLRGELLAAAPTDRDAVTREVYNRLFEKVPWHEANTFDEAAEAAYEQFWFQLYGPLTRSTDTLVDLGCGRGSLVRQFAPAVRECVGVDASDAMIAFAECNRPANAHFIAGSLIEPPLKPESVDFVVTRQVMEHLHPDDIARHLDAVLRILRPGGRFLIETPNRLTGPWDISRGFTADATGFHLHEYTAGELGTLLHRAGFCRVRGPVLPSRLQVRLRAGAARRAYVPVRVKAMLERGLEKLPVAARATLAGPLVAHQPPRRASHARQVALLAERG
ncbi:MAG: class I SAM-dependent methyltransferase [Pseudonocardiaceae bacterium]